MVMVWSVVGIGRAVVRGVNELRGDDGHALGQFHGLHRVVEVYRFGGIIISQRLGGVVVHGRLGGEIVIRGLGKVVLYGLGGVAVVERLASGHDYRCDERYVLGNVVVVRLRLVVVFVVLVVQLVGVVVLRSRRGIGGR